MNLPERFISCDWGTSNFRLRLVETDTLKVLSERRTNVGVKKRYREFLGQEGIAQNQFFGEYLSDQIDTLGLEAEANYPVVASGMLSSSIGMQELPYAKMPLDFSGGNLVHRKLALRNDLDFHLISGARTNNDVMRGEEVQAIGLAERLSYDGNGVLLLPGTHSKHLYFNKGQFTDFTTYMTGELFDLLHTQSILEPSLKPTAWNPGFQEPFLNGVAQGLANELISGLFSIRANDLLHGISKSDAYFWLSGLLIGAELTKLVETRARIYLASSGMLHTLYHLALNSVLPINRLFSLDEGVVEKALLIGHRKLLENHAT